MLLSKIQSSDNQILFSEVQPGDDHIKSFGSAIIAVLMPYVPTVDQIELSLKIYGMVGAAVLVTINIYKALKRK